jgi:hypothetical protein
MKKLSSIATILIGIALSILPFQASAKDVNSEQAIVVHFKYGSRDLKRLFQLEDKLELALRNAKVGEYDGNEVATDGSDGFLYFYGPSADHLFEVVRPALLSASFMTGAKVTLRYGPPKVGVPQKNVVLE